jgi:glycosyltransferase involved in cell wall biosynthesis
MKILSLTNTPLDPALGSGKTRLAWTNGLRNYGHDVEVLTPNDYYKPWPMGKAKRLKMRFDSQSLLTKVVKGKYDLIEFYGAEFGLLMKAIANFPRCDRPLLVAHTDGLELLASQSLESAIIRSKRQLFTRLAPNLAQILISKIDYLAFSCADCFVTGCEADLRFIVENKILPSDQCVVVEPGIDDPYLSAPWQRKKKHWLVSFASWTSRKDPDTTVKAATNLLSQIPDLEFHVVGASGSKQDILNAFAQPLQSRIIVYPRLSQEEIVEVLSQAKVLLFPSLYEGFGMATTEAMACGCAVVLTPTGFGETIRDGVDGFICNFQDVAMMTSRCSALFSDDELRLQCVEAARERVNGFGWPAQVEKLESQYRSWIQMF